MKKKFIFLTCMFLNLLVNAQNESCTAFPLSPEGTDYNVKGFTVQAAFPAANGNGRLLIKGGSKFNRFKVLNGNHTEILQPQQLFPPNYTTVAALPAGTVQVFFSTDGITYNNANSVTAFAAGNENVHTADTFFTILLYGCFEPFEISKKSGEAMLNKGKHNSNYFMRNLFNKIALEKPIHYYRQYRNNDSGKYEFLHQEQRLFQPAVKNVKAILGTGDQVYVDAGYKNQEKKQPSPYGRSKKNPCRW